VIEFGGNALRMLGSIAHLCLKHKKNGAFPQDDLAYNDMAGGCFNPNSCIACRCPVLLNLPAEVNRLAFVFYGYRRL